ncbi:hypothetical protein [Halpernia frigidisoli]|uniref:FeoB-associated Cys-rich membrane protein n=1 Tax=Halpernia frigidisoli TaxID=1125876 RepID=A0A1I3HMV4_9FLAO|nr:hypothetical protein [Halpernia frigidisoli]SFI37021.1 hypothetical protein SAMN05443292_2297 [Halpernia frigidisoli]
MNALVFQYIIIAIVFLVAGFYLFKIIAKNFSAKKFKKGKPGCDQDCGCS